MLKTRRQAGCPVASLPAAPAGPNYGSFFGRGTAENVAAVCVLAVVGVPGDGNCLFHALAAQDREARCGEELRAELVDFLERKAGDQDGVEEVWREEAEHLRGAPAERWGGAVAISAYSLLRRRRVFVRVKVAGADAAEVWSNSHPLVDADAPVVHLLYDGVGHYNALVEVELFDEMAPAWPQSLCFAPAPAEAAGAEAGGVYAKDGEFPSLAAAAAIERRRREKAASKAPATRAAKELAQELCAWPAPSPRASEAKIAAGRVVGCSLRRAFDRPRPQQDVDMASASAASAAGEALSDERESFAWLSGSLRQAAAICALAVVDVPGDGNCLFHALAMQDEAGRCGEELRAELANFLDSEAFRQDGFEEVWLEEAEHLRGPAAEWSRGHLGLFFASTKTLDYFSDRQWERVRANRSAICLACGPGKGEQKALKRKLPSGLARLDCRGCKFRKLEDAFPRAQLQQDDSEAKRRCLKCLKEVDILECSVCESTKQISEFNSAMATVPWAAVCADCAADVRRQPKWGRAGWFTCRTCDWFFPGAGAAEHNVLPSARAHAANAAARGASHAGK
ncbi:unnamed protein product, partial [Effrenium voratum]